MKKSVAMAVYNGEKYLKPQIDSIISQLGDGDELVISYNASTDSTEDILAEYAAADSRVKVVYCEEKGVTANFENALKETTGDIIFLSDQDDIWAQDKLVTVEKGFTRKNALLVLHNCEYVDENLKPTGDNLFHFRHAGKGRVHNLLKNCYQGNCMAFSRELLELALPIPRGMIMHDQWLGLMAENIDNSRVYMLNRCLISYRRHDENVSVYGIGFKNKIKYTAELLKEVNARLKKKREQG